MGSWSSVGSGLTGEPVSTNLRFAATVPRWGGLDPTGLNGSVSKLSKAKELEPEEESAESLEPLPSWKLSVDRALVTEPRSSGLLYGAALELA